MVLKPYSFNGIWVFDDPVAGLVREAFVAGVPQIIEGMLAKQSIPLDEAQTGFLLTFSAIPFPGNQLSAKKDGEEAGGTWYKTPDGQRGWLCPALFKYFDRAPENLYFSVAKSQ